jgi:hypothetical protein|tara:strand:+ start:589 stop:873 length:285 start_codon:yes stop_codon:yes gene_type:complete
MWSTERKRFTDSQWNALTLMTKEGPVKYKDEYGVRVGKVPHTFILWYPKASFPTGYKEVELSREGLQSDFWISKLHALFNVWKYWNKDLTKINI